MSDYEAIEPVESDDDLWHVQLGSGDVVMMTLEELDDAFQGGSIHENTYLWQEGATGWVTLREVAGLDADEDAAPASQAVNPFVQSDYVSDSVWPSAPPVTSFGYAAQDIYAPPLQAMGPHSTAPVVSPLRGFELDLDEQVDFGRKKRSGGKWLFAAALIGAAGFGATKYKLLPFPQASSTPVVNAMAASPVPPPEVAAPTPPPPAPAPVATTPPAAPAPETVPAKATVADEVKQRLAAADKALAERQKAKQQQLQQRHSATRSRSPRASGGGTPFRKGGEVGDPLNSAL
jgi:hypothetical protein